MAKKNVQPAESNVEITAPVVEREQKKTKVDSKQKDKVKKQKKTEKKSLKKKSQEIWSELKKVSKPTFAQVCKNTCVVIAVVAICALLLFGVDRLFSLVNNLLLP